MNNYVKRLGLSFDPFEPAAANRGFFGGGNRQRLLDQLIEQGLYNNSLVTVTGSLGSGKTSLAQEYCNSFEEEAVCVLVQATLFMNQSQFMEAVLAQLPIDSCAEDFPGRINEIRQYAGRLDLDASSLMLVVDDAHEIASEVLEAITELLDDGSSIHVLLLGEGQLSSMLQSSLSDELLDRLFEFKLEEFGNEDTVAYVNFKLASAGFDKEIPLAGSELGNVHNSSGGIPAAINTLIAGALNEAPIVDESSEREGAWLIPGMRYWIATATLVVVMVLVVVLFDPASTDSADIANRDAGSENQQSIPVPVQAEPASEETALEPGAEVEVLAVDSAGSVEVASATLNPVTDSAVDEQLAELGSGAVEREPAIEVAAAAEEFLAEQPMPESPPLVVEAVPAEPVSLVEEVVEEAAEEAVEPTVAASRMSAFEQQLLDYSPDSYTIQIMAAYSEQNISDFVSRQSLEADHGYFETRYQNRPWFVVVLGNFEDRTAANSAIEQLPESLRTLQPWVRTMADIQADIGDLIATN